MKVAGASLFNDKHMKKLPVALVFLSGLLIARHLACAQAWITTTAPLTNWEAVASSADGSKLVAVVYTDGHGGGGPIFVSSDSGTNWTLTSAPLAEWDTVASSADGTRLIAGAGFNNPGPVYTSTNSGASWISNNLPVALWGSVASSADGTKLAAGIQNGPIYTSTNSGATWTPSGAPSGLWLNIASSADGTKLVAPAYFGFIYTSTNSGATWTPNLTTTNEFWRCVASSADGNKLVAVAAYSGGSNPGPILTSTNGGISWKCGTLTGFWSYVASSADGSRLVLSGDQGSGSWISTDSGATWISNNVPQGALVGVASSADGGKLTGVVQRGNIYTWQTTVAPKLNIIPAGTNVVVSWVLPSTPFHLQKNLNLATANWSNEPPAFGFNPTTLQDQMILPRTNSSAFFRLVTP
jgi:hypothetical protein